MKHAAELRKRADGYRRLTKQISDPAVMQAISDLAGEADAMARELEKQHRIRARAHEIWIEEGCPDGRDVEFWLKAERELENEQPRRKRRS